MDKNDFISQAGDLGLQRVSAPIASSVMECIRISSTPEDDLSIDVKKSKLGGNPDLPPDFEWPSWEGTRLAFLFQVNLSEIARIPISMDLPISGLLSFFYHPDQTTWGFDPKDIGSWRTYYFEDEEKLVRTVTPNLKSKYLDGPYNSCSVSLYKANSFPSPYSAIINEMQLTEAEYNAYMDLFELLNVFHPEHQMFGHPNNIQNPMEIECELATDGIYLGDGKWSKHPQLDVYKEKSKDWRLLLQLDSDDNAGMIWGDVGMLYFWIRKSSILDEQFESTWMILQCT
jgi:uncharacterized protein YwqG